MTLKAGRAGWEQALHGAGACGGGSGVARSKTCVSMKTKVESVASEDKETGLDVFACVRCGDGARGRIKARAACVRCGQTVDLIL